MITRRTLLLSAPLFVLAPRAWAKDIPVTLYRDPGCGCCENYVAYLRRHGFEVTVKSAAPDEISAISRKAGIPPDLQGCHTAFIGGYAVDGLVPIAAVQKLLKDRPPLKGITLPGMPPGAPGMTGAKKGKLTVFAIPKEGKPSVFMTF
ncbi:MAG TPA: DUF411 domain-containing protein [Stellaceae bacterium]|nr:DUF411 domain-containing protein [Stellaceae bacterium]